MKKTKSVQMASGGDKLVKMLKKDGDIYTKSQEKFKLSNIKPTAHIVKAAK